MALDVLLRAGRQAAGAGEKALFFSWLRGP
jgi:hypothetical protein